MPIYYWWVFVYQNKFQSDSGRIYKKLRNKNHKIQNMKSNSEKIANIKQTLYLKILKNFK